MVKMGYWDDYYYDDCRGYEELECLKSDTGDSLIRKDEYKEFWKPLLNSKLPKQKYFVKIKPYVRNKLAA